MYNFTFQNSNREFSVIINLFYLLQELHGTVEQRMRWACGANPDLQVNTQHFFYLTQIRSPPG